MCPTGEDAGLDLTLAYVKMAQPVPCLFIWVVGISHPALAGPGLSEEPRTEAARQRAQSGSSSLGEADARGQAAPSVAAGAG